MLTNLFTYLKYEQQILEELVSLAQQQQKALVKFDVSLLEETTSYQEQLLKTLKEAEEQRINFLTSLLKISKKEALNIKLSALEKYFDNDELKELRKLKKEMNILTIKLQNFNTMNRVLANRAKNNVASILNILNNNGSSICNVKI